MKDEHGLLARKFPKIEKKHNSFLFTPYNPESPSLQTGDEDDSKSKDKDKPRPLGRGYTGFISGLLSANRLFDRQERIDTLRDLPLQNNRERTWDVSLKLLRPRPEPPSRDPI